MSRCTPSRETSGPWPAFASGNFVHFVDEQNAHLLHAVDRDARHLIHIDQAVFFFLDQIVEGLGNRHLALLFLLAEHAGKHVLHVDVHFLDALIGDDFKRGHGALAHFHFHQALIELSFAELRAQLVARALGLLAALRFGAWRVVGRARARRGQQQIQQPLFGGLLGALGHFIELFFAHHVDGRLHEIAHHRFHVAAHVSHFGILRRFDLHERASRQPRQPPRDFRFAHAGGPDHQDILRQNVFGEFGLQFLPPHAVAQRDGHGFLRGVLPDDVFVELDDDFARRQLVERRNRLRLSGRLVSGQVNHHVFLLVFLAHSSSMLKLEFVKMQISLAMRMASWAMSFAPIFVCFASARAAASA